MAEYMLQIVKDKIAYSSISMISSKPNKLQEAKSPDTEDQRTVKKTSLSRAVQAEMQANPATYYFLTGYTGLLLCDYSDMMYKQKKI